MRLFLKLMLLGALVAPAQGQDRRDWQSLARLQSGDRIRMHLKTGAVSGALQNWTPEGVTVGTVTTRREDVLKIERYGRGGSRAKHIAVGVLIGFGAGFAAGASVRQYGVTRPQGGAIIGGLFAVIGAVVGAISPARTKEVIYSTK